MYPGVLCIIINICSLNNSTSIIFSFNIRQAKSGIGHPAYDSVIRAMACCHRHSRHFVTSSALTLPDQLPVHFRSCMRLFNFLPQIIKGSGGWRSGVLSLKNKASATGKVIFFTLIFIYSMIIFTISIHLPTPLFLSYTMMR